MKLSLFYIVLWLVSMVLLSACSTHSGVSNSFNNLTAHFNAYFYAKEGVFEVEEMVLKTLDDDPEDILLLYPRLDTVTAKTYKANTNEVIKMASISIQRHPNSRWANPSYLMVGYARLYTCDYQNAILTFKYVNTKSHDIHVRHAAILGLVRTFSEMRDYDRAEEAIRFLEQEKPNRVNQKKLLLEKANYYQIREDYKSMVNALAHVDSLLTRKDRRGRIFFIMGQIYQQLGAHDEANVYYKKCLRTNPDYEVDFYARINLVQVTRLTDQRVVLAAQKQFNNLLKDAKNINFKDKIYFEYGEFERKQNHLKRAIKEYKLATHAGKNKRVKAVSYLRIGQINFDSLKNYKPAKLYYDSAVQLLPKKYPNLDAIKKRQSILGEFVKYQETITLNDSLLHLASLDTATIRRQLDSAARAKVAIVALNAKKRKRKNRNTDSDDSESSVSPSGNTNNSTGNSNSNDWYFSSLDAIATGQTEFARIWGNIPLEDNWRRSGRSAAFSDQPIAAAVAPTDSSKVNKKQAAPKNDELTALLAQLPHTPKQKEAALAKVENAYFHLGDLYYFNLNEKENATQSYETLLKRFPNSEKAAEVLYKLYLMHKDKSNRADAYAQRLQRDFPNSVFAKLLINPNYLNEVRALAEQQMAMYKEAYILYQQNNLKQATEKVNAALQLGETSFVSKLELLKILIQGRTDAVPQYQFALGEFIKKYPKDTLKTYAQTLLTSSQKLTTQLEKANGVAFSSNLSAPHYFVVVYSEAYRITSPVVDVLHKFNSKYFKNLKLTAGNLGFKDKTITYCFEFNDPKTAMDYYYKFTAEVATQKPFSDHKFYKFVITKENFQTFYRTQSLDAYLTFFDKNYQK